MTAPEDTSAPTTASKTPGSETPLDDKCGGLLRDGSGRYCTRPRGWGTDHAGFGKCKLHSGSSPSGRKAAQREQAAEAMRRLGLPVVVDPVEAMIAKLHLDFGHAAWLQTMLEEQTAIHDGDRPHVLWTMWRQVSTEAGRTAEACHRMGISEREIRLAEQHATLVAGGFIRLLESAELALTAEQREVGRHVAGSILRELSKASALEVEGVAV